MKVISGFQFFWGNIYVINYLDHLIQYFVHDNFFGGVYDKSGDLLPKEIHFGQPIWILPVPEFA